MATLSEMVIYHHDAYHRFTISIWLYRLIWRQGEKGRDTKELQQLKYLSTKIKMASNVAITVKNGKLCQTKRIPETQGAFLD